MFHRLARRLVVSPSVHCSRCSHCAAAARPSFAPPSQRAHRNYAHCVPPSPLLAASYSYHAPRRGYSSSSADDDAFLYSADIDITIMADPAPAPAPAAAAADAAVEKAAADVAKVDITDADKQKQQQQQQQQREAKKAAKKAKKKKGGNAAVDVEPPFVAQRLAVWDRLKAAADATIAAKEKPEITVTLPDGKVLPGKAWETTPMDIAKQISKAANQFVVARVHTAAPADRAADDEGVLWDLERPLEGSVHLGLLRFDDPAAKHVFWHSSSHILGQALERNLGARLSIGPALDNGFYYDCTIPAAAPAEGAAAAGADADAAAAAAAAPAVRSVTEEDWAGLKAVVAKITKAKQPFERLVLAKADALEMFAGNKYKEYIIGTKVPDGETCTAYRCGPLIDLCRGPHLPHTGKVKAFEIEKNTGAYWLGKQENEVLQRIYGVAFPDKKELKVYLEFKAEAARRDHIRIGVEQELFMRHRLSPGCVFFLPHGARVYNRLVDMIKKQYWQRGYEEVMTPNFFNAELWKQSGHYQHYKDDMFFLKHDHDAGDDGAPIEYALKPMNCPGHCLMFAAKNRSWRDLPIRWADFGVLHRDEASGALHGLTRVRRFQQDDSHIFCTVEQVRAEMRGVLDFMQAVYGIFGFTFSLELSTRPEKFLGEPAVWDKAEAELEAMLVDFGAKWKLNPGDGAFYGPKIDVHITDALRREHQCATIQLDFQLPINFDLTYAAPASAGEGGEGGEGGGDNAMRRPVIIHRAILGSVERMMGILIEHTAGKWPLWVSPRQMLVVPVAPKYYEYAHTVRNQLHDEGFFIDVDDGGDTMKKKIRGGQLAQYNYILVVGEKELEAGSVNVRTRDNVVHGTQSIAEFAAHARKECDEYK